MFCLFLHLDFRTAREERLQNYSVTDQTRSETLYKHQYNKRLYAIPSCIRRVYYFEALLYCYIHSVTWRKATFSLLQWLRNLLQEGPDVVHWDRVCCLWRQPKEVYENNVRWFVDLGGVKSWSFERRRRGLIRFMKGSTIFIQFIALFMSVSL